MRPDIAPGAAFPDYQLPDHTGTPRKLSELQQDEPGRVLQKELDIVEFTDPFHDPMVPHTLVLEPGLRVYKIYNGYWFFGRPTVEELRLDLRAVLQRRRTDWDISGAKREKGNGQQAVEVQR